MKRVHSLNVLALGILFIMPMLVSAQTNVLHRVFDFSSASSHVEMTSDDDFVFENCWAIKGANLQIGSSSALGSVTTRSLGLNGNAVLVVRVIGASGDACYKVTSINGGTIDVKEHNIVDKEDRIDAILIRDGGPNTCIKLESIEGKFDLGSIEVVSIGDGYFHESFSRMVADNHMEFGRNSSEDNPPLTKLDNITGSFLGEQTCQSEGCIKFMDKDDSNYTTPTLAVSNENMALLSFKVANEKGSLQTPSFILTCSGNTKMTQPNSVDLNNLSNEVSIANGEARKWVDYFVVVKDIEESTHFTFKGRDFFLDDVKLTPYAILDEQSDNSTVIFNNRGNCWVTLTRTLGKGYWNTLCLPFDITQNELAEVAGEGADAEIQTLASASAGVFRFEPVAADATIEAGTPFIVKVSKKVVNPQFRNVVLKDVAAKAIENEKGNYQFVGTYSPVNLNTDKTHYFLGKDGKLKYPGTTANKMNGLRAYFVTPATDGGSRVSINGEEMDAIELVDIDRQNDVPVYDLRGVRHNTEMLGKGVYIRDGRKIVIK